MKRGHIFQIAFASLGAVIVLWQMLLPGYVLTLDMVFGPSHTYYAPQGFLNSLPLSSLIFVLSSIVPAWVVEKILLIVLFFLLFYLPLRFFPKVFDAPAWVRYFVAIFYCVNPFVYERFLAGHWALLFAYALLAPLFYWLLEFLRKPNLRSGAWFAACILLIGLFSLHALVMVVLFSGLAIVVETVRLLYRAQRSEMVALIKYAAIMGVIVLVVSSYWIVPALLSPQNSPVAAFTAADNAAFMTAPEPNLGITGNVILLYGFWGEGYQWAQSFLSPKTSLLFLPAALVLFVLIVAGIFSAPRTRISRFAALLIALFGLLALVFSTGVDGLFGPINAWLFAHISFWRGFRDSEKWSMWLALAYAYFGALGAGYFVQKISPRIRAFGICAALVIPILYCPYIIGGFWGQINAVQYPQSWGEINNTLKAAPNCKALFLPWHLYYSLSFNDDIITANPAKSFFDCDIVSGENAEIGTIDTRGIIDDEYHRIQAAVTDPAQNTASLDTLQKYGIRYVIVTGDLLGVDPYTYPFLSDSRLKKVAEAGSGRSTMRLYSVQGGLPK